MVGLLTPAQTQKRLSDLEKRVGSLEKDTNALKQKTAKVATPADISRIEKKADDASRTATAADRKASTLKTNVDNVTQRDIPALQRKDGQQDTLSNTTKGRVDALDTKISQLEAKMRDVPTKADIDQKISVLRNDLKRDIGTANSDIEKLKNRVGQIEPQIKGLQDDGRAFKSRFTTIENKLRDIDDVKTRVGKIETEAGKIRDKFTAIKSSASKAASKVAPHVTSMSNHLKDVAKELQTFRSETSYARDKFTKARENFDEATRKWSTTATLDGAKDLVRSGRATINAVVALANAISSLQAAGTEAKLAFDPIVEAASNVSGKL